MLRLLAIIIFIVAAGSSQAAYLFPMEITNIKPAGTGSPAIPATNRIFRAYPGIEYNIRAAVIGGVYPYTYSLSNAPLGMTINSKTGEITWPNPQSNSGTITLSVKDSANTTVTSNWDIIVSTSGFHFVDASYSGTETGSISQPYRSLANFLEATLNGNGSDIVYFKSGTYQMVHWNADKPDRLNIQNNPRNWLAYPGHTVTLQGGTEAGQASGLVVWGGDFYFDGLIVKDTIGYSIFTSSKYFYKTIRRCKFTGLVPPDNTNNNYGFIHITSSTVGYGAVIQDNEFTDWTGASAIGSIYSENKMLIENNRIHSPRALSTHSGIGATIGIASKVGNDYITIRGNSVVMNKGYLIAGHNGMYYNGAANEICFNLIVNTGSAINLWDWEIGYQKETKYWRNTTIAPIAHRSPSNTGPYTYIGNVISNSGAPYNANHEVTDFISHPNTISLSAIASVSESLTGANTALLVDATNNYKLVPAHSAYVGSRGWQLADGSTPLESVPAAWFQTPRRLSLGGSLIKLAEPGP